MVILEALIACNDNAPPQKGRQPSGRPNFKTGRLKMGLFCRPPQVHSHQSAYLFLIKIRLTLDRSTLDPAFGALTLALNLVAYKGLSRWKSALGK